MRGIGTVDREIITDTIITAILPLYEVTGGYFCVGKGGKKPLEQFFMQTYTAALPIILTALMGYIVWLLKNQKKDRDANGKGTMLLLRVQLIEYHDRYMAKGDIPSYAYENFMEMYDAYHELGGNGMVTKMKHEIEELHLKKKEV